MSQELQVSFRNGRKMPCDIGSMEATSPQTIMFSFR
jgi:hypothetical protein